MLNQEGTLSATLPHPPALSVFKLLSSLTLAPSTLTFSIVLSISFTCFSFLLSPDSGIHSHRSCSTLARPPYFSPSAPCRPHSFHSPRPSLLPLACFLALGPLLACLFREPRPLFFVIKERHFLPGSLQTISHLPSFSNSPSQPPAHHNGLCPDNPESRHEPLDC